jgi:CD109 antigen
MALTAYTLITFLENKKLASNYKSTIQKALNFIVENVDSLEDNYSLAIVTYALQLANHDLKDVFLQKLLRSSVNEDGTRHWERKTKANSIDQRPNSLNIEMTAYALQAFAEAGRLDDAVKIMKWLVAQRNKNAGFVSTQDTTVGLQALANIAAKIYSRNTNIDITVSSRDSVENYARFQVTTTNGLVHQKHEVPFYLQNFQVIAKGRGFSVFQLSYMNSITEVPRFSIEPRVQGTSNKEFLYLVVSTNFIPDHFEDKSNMAVMEISLPSGFAFDKDSLPALQATEKVKVKCKITVY